MQIIKTSKDYTAAELYKMTRDAGIMKMSLLENGTELPLDAFCLYEDINQKTGEVMEILSIETNGKHYATNSATFIREFKAIMDLFNDDCTGVVLRVVRGTSKAGRNFLTCGLA